MSRSTQYFSPRRPWFASVNRDSLRADAVAGFTNAAIVLPQGVAFAIIAGLPPEYGLFTAMIPPIIAAYFGSSTVMVSGPTTAISAVLFATLSELAPPGTPAYIEMALVVTIMVGLMQLVAGLARLGAVISFVSHSVIVGFTAAAALLIGASQLAPALGIEVERGGSVLERLYVVWQGIGGTEWRAFLLAGVTLGLILAVQRISKKLPAYLIALAGGSALGLLIGAEANGIAMFAPLPAIIPSFHMPDVDIGRAAALAPGAATIAFVALLEAISIGRDFAHRREERYDSNQEIVGQGLSNIVGGFFKCYAGSGSFTRSALNAENGARTPLSAIMAAAFLLAMLLLLSPFIRFIPVPVMAGIILNVAWRLIDTRELKHIADASRSDTVIFLLTLATGLIVDLEFAIVAGVFASLLVFLRRSSMPLVAILAPAIANGHRTLRGARTYNLQQCPQIAIVRIEGPLYFASVETIEEKIDSIEREFGPRRSMILYLRGVGTVDLSGSDFLIKEHRKLRDRGGRLHLVVTYKDVLERLRRSHVIEIVGEENMHLGKGPAISACTGAVDPEICRTCTARVFHECATLPAPEGLEGVSDEQVVDAR